MLEVNTILKSDTKLEMLSVCGLSDLYVGTIEELRQCAMRMPSFGADGLADDMREAALLNLEANLLEQAARIQLHSVEDLQGLMDIWSKVSGIHSGHEGLISDRIAMNIFRHVIGEKFAID